MFTSSVLCINLHINVCSACGLMAPLFTGLAQDSKQPSDWLASKLKWMEASEETTSTAQHAGKQHQVSVCQVTTQLCQSSES